MRKVKALLMVLLLVGTLVPMHPVHADMAPPPAPQLGGLEPFQYQTTNVQMVYERVEMEIQPLISQDDHFLNDPVTVTAYFTLRNLGDKLESMQAIFPLESFTNCLMGYSSGNNSYTEYYVKEDSFSVLVNGINAPIQKVVTDHPYGKNNSYSEACSKMSWAGFDVMFPVGEDVVVRVQYAMESGMVDYMQNIEYILETGAGWAGSIERGYVVVKFPYIATSENILAESTPGYQFLYNEIFWSFENLEPTSEDNIQVSIVSPEVWQQILTLRREVKENPKLPANWLQLAQIYEGISAWHGSNLRSSYYDEKISPTYKRGIELNPDNASLYSNYALSVFSQCCYFQWDTASEADRESIMNLINKSLSLDPTDPIAHDIVNILKSQNPDLTFTPPPTIPPTPTSLFTATPSITPSATITPIPSETSVVVTVVHTKIVSAPTFTQIPQPTATVVPTEIDHPDETQKESSSSPMILGVLIVFAVGAGVGLFWSKRTKR